MALKRKYKYSSYRWLLHVLVWTVYFTLTILPAIINNTKPNAQAYYITHFLILLTTTYVNIFVLVKKYFNKEDYKRYLIGVFFLWLVGIVAVFFSSVFLEYPLIENKLYLKKIISAMFGFSVEFFLLSFFKASKELYFKSKRSKELEIEKMQAELGLLRSQLDTHFLFNTLNNIYLLVLNRSEKAPDAILMLSDLLSYNIYDSRQRKVSLAQERTFIENYINLQKLRLNDDQKVYFEVTGDMGGMIEPLILFNFIENVFKHASKTIDIDGQKYYAHIKISVNNGCLNMITINGYDVDKGIDNNHKREGIGIENTIKRLEMAYPDSFTLKIDKPDDRRYHVHLTIKDL